MFSGYVKRIIEKVLDATKKKPLTQLRVFNRKEEPVPAMCAAFPKPDKLVLLQQHRSRFKEKN